MKIALQIIGLILVVAGIQGLMPLFAGTDIDGGYLSWLSIGIDIKFGLYTALAVAGGYLAYWSQKKSRSVAK
jgi:hypothetical protein